MTEAFKIYVSTQADIDKILLNLSFGLNEATNTFALFTFYQK